MRKKILAAAVLAALMTWGAASALSGPGFHGSGKTTPKVPYDSLYAVADPVSESAEGQALLAHCIRSYGGVAHLRDLRGVRLRHMMSSVFGGGETEVVRSFAEGRRYRIQKPDNARLLNHERAWFERADTLLALDSGRYNAELYSFLSLQMPRALVSENSSSLRYGTREGDNLGYFYMDKPDTLMIVVGIDPHDGMIRTTEGVIRQGDKSYVFVSKFDDHGEHDGYVFPGSLVNISMGLEVARSRLVGVEINPDFAPEEFLPASSPRQDGNL